MPDTPYPRYPRPHGFAQHWFWVYPAWQVSVAADHDRPVAWLLCLAAGAAWQLVYRRDLANRLTRVGVFVAVMIVLTAAIEVGLGGDVHSELGRGAAMAVISCLTGLVLTEQLLRNRELTRLRRAQRSTAVPAQEAVPGRP